MISPPPTPALRPTMNIDKVDDKRMGFPSPLPKFPVDVSPVPKGVSDAINWNQLSGALERILERRNIKWNTYYLHNQASQYDGIMHTTIMVIATAHNDSDIWYHSLVDIRNLLEMKGITSLSVEFLDPTYPTEPYVFPLELGHPIASKWGALYDRVEGVLYRHGLSQTWSTLSVYRRGWTDKFEDSEPYLVITTPNTAPMERILPELKEAVALMQVLCEVEIIQQSNEFLFATSDCRQILTSDDFSNTTKVGCSLGLQNSKVAATFGGSAWLTYQDGSRVRVGMTNFHILAKDIIEPVMSSHQDVKYSSFESPSEMDKDQYIQTQDEVLAFHEEKKKVFEEWARYGDDRAARNWDEHQAMVLKISCQKKVAQTFDSFCGSFYSGSGLRAGPSGMFMDWLLFDLPDNRPSDNRIPPTSTLIYCKKKKGVLSWRSEDEGPHAKLSLGSLKIPEEGSDIFKIGMTSGLSYGIIGSAPMKIQCHGVIAYGLLVTGKGIRPEFQMDGDSGALAFDMDGNVLGLMNIRTNHVPHKCSGVLIPIDAILRDIEEVTGGKLSFDI